MGLKSNDRFLLFWSLLGAVGMLTIWHLPWRFQVNDDEIMMWLVSGAYTGKPESFAVFLHPVLSWGFAKLYTVAPAVKWYPACWFLTMFLGYLGYERLIWSRAIENMQAQVWSLFALCILVHFLFFLQFSAVSAFAISAGLANRFGRDSSETLQVFRFYFTDLLLLIGFLIRPEILFLSLAAYLVLSLLVVRNSGAIKRLVIPALILVLGYGVSKWYTEKYDLGEFQRINTLRSQVFDHPMLQLYKDEFKNADPDLYHFANGLMDFGRERDLVGKLEVWKSNLDARRTEKFSAEFLIHSLTFYLYHGRFFALLMAAFLLFAFAANRKRGLLALVLLILGLLFLAPFYLIKVQIYVLVFLVYFSFSLIHSDMELRIKVPLVTVFVFLSGLLMYHLSSFMQSFQNVMPGDPIRKELRSLYERGTRPVYLIEPGNVTGNLYFDRPLNFKKLGWPTLLDDRTPDWENPLGAYLVDSATYSGNREYFESFAQRPSIEGWVLLVPKR
ncbi:hypothetical protein [Algoriphagus sp. A40]|uniref:hypothetical protein n=1 Tax=Algoriphagus sp. A40 TaxID=1945863 RepID=UPI000986FD70|nr:hypothetical protein [Algoriphagus sp. A40]OOG74572.1 hypothetical protein B0E43_11265 [Algoriphagus sp. A40]